MITPSSTSARMLSAVCETSVPSRTGNVSRIRPMRRERTIALAGSPRRAGSVADISTPIIVAEVTSRRRSALAGQRRPGRSRYQEAARKNIDGHHQRARDQHPREVRADDALDDACRSRSAAPRERSGRGRRRSPTPSPTGRATRRPRPRPWSRVGSSEGRRSAGSRGPPSIGDEAGAPSERLGRPVGRGRGTRSRARRRARPARRSAARRSARRCRGPRAPIATRRLGLDVQALQLLGEPLRVGRRDQDAVDAVADDVGVAGDRRRRPRGVPAANASVRTMPKLSPASEGAQSTSASCELAPEIARDDPAERVDRLISVRVGERARDRPRGRRRRRSGGRARARPAPRRRASRTGRPLRSSARPTKSSRSSSLGGFGLGGAALDVDAVRDDLVVAAEPATPGPRRGLGDGDPRASWLNLRRAPSRSRCCSGSALGASRRGMCRRPAPRGSGIASQPRIGAGGSWTWTTSKSPARSSRRRVVIALREDERLETAPLAPKPTVRPERHQVVGQLPELAARRRGAASAEAVRRVPGSEHADLVPSVDQLLGERLDVPVDASLVRPGIGGDERDAHWARVPVLKAELRDVITARSLTRTACRDYAGSTDLHGRLCPGEGQSGAQRRAGADHQQQRRRSR